MSQSFQCVLCANLDTDNRRKCRAFKIIPIDIMVGDHDHRTPYPGDNGIRFEKIKKGSKNNGD